MASTLNSVIGALRVDLSLDSASFKKGLATAKSGLSSFGQSFKNVLGNVAKMAKVAFLAIVAAATAAFAAISAGVVSLANDAKQIDQMSKAFGMSAKSYQSLTLAAAKYGVGQDKVNDTIKDSNEKLGEFIATGGGGLKDFMEQIAKPQGVSAEELINLPPEERFIKMQGMMEAMNVPLEMQSFYWESIASDSTYLIPLLANGGAEAKKLTAEFERMGLILSDSTVASLSKFDTSLGTIGQTMKGWGNILISGFAPQIEEITTKFSNFLGSADGIRNAFSIAGQFIGTVLGKISEGASTAYQWFTRLGGEGTRLGSIMQSLGTIWDGIMTVFRSFAPLVMNILGVWFDYLYMLGDAFITAFDVGLQAIASIAQPIASAAATMYDAFNNAVTWIRDALAELPQNASYAFNLMVAYGQGGANAIVEGFKALPAALGDLMYQAANQVITAIARMVDGAINIIKAGIDLLPEWANLSMDASNLAGSWQIENPYKDAAGGMGKNFGETFSAEANKVIKERAGKEAAKIAFGNLPKLAGVPAGLQGQPATTGETPTSGITQPPKVTLPNLPVGDGSGGGGGGGESEAAKQSKAFEDLEKRVSDLGKTFGMTALQRKIFDEQQKVGGAASAQAVTDLVTQEDRLLKFKDTMDEVGGSFTSNFEGMLTGAKSFRAALGGWLSSIASMLAKSALNGLWGSMIGGMGGAASGGGFWGGVGKIFGFAVGTRGAPGNSLSLVGEHGPELMQLPAGTKIRSNNETNKLLSGSASGVTRIEIGYSKDTEARVLEQSRNQSVSLVQQGLNSMGKQLPSMIDAYTKDSKKR